MKGITRRVLIPVLGSHVLAFLALLVFQIVTGDKQILQEFAWDSIIQSTIVMWIDYFIPITVSGFILGFSVFINSGEMRSILQGENSFGRIAGKSVILVLLVSFVFVALTGFVYGSARQQRDTWKSYSIRAHAFMLEAQTMANNGQITEAAATANKALLISPKYRAASDLQGKLSKMLGAREEVKSALAKEGQAVTTIGGQGEPVQEIPPVPTAKQGIEYEDNLNLAKEYMERGDNYSALYFIRKASEGVKRQDPALIALKTEVEIKIRSSGRSDED